MSLRSFVVCACALLATAVAPLKAQPAPVVNAPAPLSIQRGQSVEIALTGAALAGVTSVALPEDSGLTATLVKPGAPDDAALKLALVASDDAAPGLREIRLVSPAGVSAPVPVWVEQFPLASDTEPNNTPDAAQTVSLPAVITGRIDVPGDSDQFRFVALKGQQLVFSVLAARARSGLDGNLLLYDAATGREVMSNNDTFGADPFLAFEVPADGAYVLELRDLQYRGGDNFTYRIEAGAIPFIQSLSPTSSRRGTAVEVKPAGFNLAGVGPIKLDLAHVPPGRIPLRVKTPAGFSNEVSFDVTELPQVTEVEPNDDAKTATVVSPGVDISGAIDKPGDIDFVRFKLDQPTRVLVDALARRIDSPLDALLTLHDAAGAVIATNDDAAGADPRLGRDLPAGEYLLSIRDLGYNGGPAFAYRVSLHATLAPADAPPQDFSLKFQPDTPRIHRGGYAKLWCEVGRLNFPADVTLAVEGLPPGVTVASPTVFPPVTSGILMLAASADAPLGTFPISIKAAAPLGAELVTRIGQPEAAGRVVQQAYLTVLDAAPFTVQPLATLPPERVQQLAGEVATLAAQVLGPSPEVDARQAEWEKKVAAETAWTTLDPSMFTSTGHADLVKQPDGAILAQGANPATEIYTITAATDLKNVAAVRLECFTDPTLGAGGPGRAPNGNFVLNRFTCTVAPKADPGKPIPVEFGGARATFSQGAFDVAGAIDDNPATGWAIAPEMGKKQTAIFLTKTPIGGEGGSVLTFKLEHAYGSNHVIGKFRLSVSADASAADAAPAPEPILAIVKVPAEQRTPEQKAALGTYYRTIDPPLAPVIARLALDQTLAAPQAEMARLDAALNQQSPQLDAEQAQWEQSIAAGLAWTPLDASRFASAAGASFAKEGDGSVFVFGPAVPTDTYTFVAPTNLKAVTGLRIEALPDPRLPGNGPGRAPSGNFILSGVKVAVASAADANASVPVELSGAAASFQQENYSAAAALDDKPETGWAIAPTMGYPSAAEYFFKTPQGAEGGSIFTVTLEHLASAIPQHTLGRFRISLTTAPTPDVSVRLPSNVLAILKIPADQRNEDQKAEIAAYHRRISRLLQPVRQRLTEFRSVVPAFPPVLQRTRAGYLPVAITRGESFSTGDVQVTLEGFALGRDGDGPAPIARSIKATPLTISADNVIGALTFTVEGNAEQGARLAVLRAEAKVGNDTIVQYSPAFVLNVN